ncbi:MAG: class I SAM-dependent rRNA methyltransferase [Phycisphaeraceae bacterium]
MTLDADILTHVPAPSARPVSLRVTPAAERAIQQGHPWVFDQAITDQNHDEGHPGDLAVIYRSDRRFLALGLFDPDSNIRVRILHRGKPVTIDQAWFDAALLQSVRRRDSIEPTGTTGYRIVHGENDQLPGLIVDRYDATFVLKIYTAAWIPHLDRMLHALGNACRVERIVLRLSRGLQEQTGNLHGLSDGIILRGDPLHGPVLFKENGLTFEADPIRGHKTGFFLDQRDNRARIEPLSAGKDVLNVFAYSGGFSLYAARGGARSVVSLDISQPALDAAVRHFALNKAHPNIAAAEHERLCADAFDAMKEMARDRRRFDLVIIDPPAFATKQAHVDRAIAAYEQLTGLGLDLLEPGGKIVMASCSSRVDDAAFFQAVQRAARRSGRPLRDLEQTGHAVDHPIGFKEGAYLKCLFATA